MPAIEPIDCIVASAVLDYQPKSELFDPIECKVEHAGDSSNGNEDDQGNSNLFFLICIL